MSSLLACALVLILQPPAEPKLADVLAKLQDSDTKVRLQAVTALANWKTDLDPRTIAALAKVIDDPDPRVRKTAVQTLGEVGPRAREWGGGPKFSAGLAKLFNDKDALTRKAAVRAYGLVGIDSADELKPLFEVHKDPSADMRGLALNAMAQYAHEEAPADMRRNLLDRIADSLADKDARMQQLARDILFKSGAEAVPALTRMLDSGTGRSRAWAALVLGEIGAPARDAIPNLQKALGEVPKDDRPFVQAALKKLGL